MLRSVLAFLAGYAAMAVLVMVGFVVGPLLMGVDRVLKPGLYEASDLWQWIGLAIGLFAAGVGGMVCRLIAKGTRAPLVLAILACLFAIASGVVQKPAPQPPPVRPDNEPVPQLLQHMGEYAREPLLTRVGNPIVAGLGVLLGSGLVGSLRRNKPGGARPEDQTRLE